MFAWNLNFLLLLVNRVYSAQIVAIWCVRQATILVNVQKTLFGTVSNVKIKAMKMQIAQAINVVDKMQVLTVQSCISARVKQNVLPIASLVPN